MRFRSLRLLVAFLRRRSIRLALVMSLFSALLLWSLLPAVTISKPATSRPDHPPVAWFHRRHLVAAGNETCKYTSSEGLVIADEMGRVCQLTDAALNGCCQMGSSSLHTCESCSSIHCCSIYEHCVSCCLDPSNIALRRHVFQNLTQPLLVRPHSCMMARTIFFSESRAKPIA
eukprot:m.42949 g.42949  ORF g.42949 m.42949 type:complete len:173 (-) comp11990_c0_seq4:539-1057(-)